MNGKPHKRFPWLWYMLALFVIVAFAFAPIGSVMLCAAIANYPAVWLHSGLIGSVYPSFSMVAWRKRMSLVSLLDSPAA